MQPIRNIIDIVMTIIIEPFWISHKCELLKQYPKIRKVFLCSRHQTYKDHNNTNS